MRPVLGQDWQGVRCFRQDGTQGARHPSPPRYSGQRMNARRAAVTLALVLAVLCGTTGTAHAYTGDRIGAARHAVLGTTAKNFRTHVWTTIIGTYAYDRIVRHNGHRHRVTFHGITVSAQRCKSDGCWGVAKERRLWSRHQRGTRPASASRSGTLTQAGAVMDFCLSPAGTHCAAPWNWAITDPVNRLIKPVRVHLMQPCAAGLLAGFGVKVAEKTAGAILAEEGVLTVAERVAGIVGPEGYGVGMMAGCFVGVGAHGVANIGTIVDSLNPFDRSAPR